jgi:hypothetical protein
MSYMVLMIEIIFAACIAILVLVFILLPRGGRLGSEYDYTLTQEELDRKLAEDFAIARAHQKWSMSGGGG